VRGLRLAATAAAACLALGALAGPVRAATEDDRASIDAALADAGDDLEGANALVAKAVKDLEAARQKLPGARSALATARTHAEAAAEADRVAQDELEQATAAAIRAEQERAEVEFQIEDLQSRVGNLAREVYQSGSFANFDLLISAGSPTELADRAAALDAVSRVNNTTLAKMAATRAELRLKEARLAVLRDEVDRKRSAAAATLRSAKLAQSKAAAAKAEVDLLVAQRATALDVAATQRAKVLKQYKTVQAEQERIAALLAQEAAAEAARLARGGKARAGDGGASGLVWPVVGARVSQGVGPRVHPVYGYRSCHTGIDLGARTGTPILATASGIVVSTATGGPYGWHTVISHGNGLFSMYAHQSRFAVGEGQRVAAGQVIGYVGSTGWSTGAHLHFEIHIGSKPYNPMGWFGGAKEPVNC
jgi:murein DD-endopeptidase MepM/ murein hydrolase activator NlpD